jgi:hypothetical protein
MYVIFVKEDGRHTVRGIVETVEEVKEIIKSKDIMGMVQTGKAYLIEGEIKLIRPEITPELLNIKASKKDRDRYY